MADEENKCECPCTGWKVGFYIFVALSVILFIIVLILLFSKKAQEKTTDLRVKAATAVRDKLGNWINKKNNNDNVVYDKNGNPIGEIENSEVYEGVGGYGELDRILSSTTE